MSEKWVINENPYSVMDEVVYTIGFTSNNTHFDTLTINKSNGNQMYYDNTQVFSLVSFITPTWVNNAYKTIELDQPASGNLLTWLNAHATKQEEPITDTYDEYVWVNGKYERIGGATIDLSEYQTKQDNNLQTTSKQIVGAINEVNTNLSSTSSSLSSQISTLNTNKQNKSDNSLNTTSKNIVGAINELNSGKQSTLSTSNKLNTNYINTSSSVRFTSDTEINSKQDKLPTITNDRYLHTNSSTGALEWVEVQGGGTEFLETEISLVEEPEEEPEGETWLLNESPVIDATNSYTINFTSNNEDYTSLMTKFDLFSKELAQTITADQIQQEVLNQLQGMATEFQKMLNQFSR